MKKQKWLLALLGVIACTLDFSCGMENNASVQALNAARSEEFISPLDAAQLDFQPAIAGLTTGSFVNPTPVRACCWQRRRDPRWLLDGVFLTEPDGNTVGGFWDWAWDGTVDWNNTSYQALGNGTHNSGGDDNTDWTNTWQITNTNAGTGHKDYFGAGKETHFVTFDLGEVKRNIFRVGYYPRNASSLIAEYDIWISSNAASTETDELKPWDAAGWTKAAHGEWEDNGWQYADFTADALSNGPVDARYIQIRSFRNPVTTSGASFQVGGREVKFDIAGDFDGTIDKSYLQAVYIKGVPLLPELRKAHSASAATLETLLYGKFEEVEKPNGDGTGTVMELELKTPGAKQLLFDAVPEDFVEKVDWQNKIDSTTKKLIVLINSLTP